MSHDKYDNGVIMLNIQEYAVKLDKHFDWLSRNAKGKMHLKYNQILSIGFEIARINQTELASSIGMSKQSVSKWMNGGGIPSYANFLKMLTLIERGMYKFFNSDDGNHIMVVEWNVNYDEVSLFTNHLVTLYRKTYLNSLSEAIWTGEQVDVGKGEWSDWVEKTFYSEKPKKEKATKAGPIYDNQFASFLMQLVIKQSYEEDGEIIPLKDHPYLIELKNKDTKELNNIMKDSNKSYQVGFDRVTDAIEMSELADNGIAQKMLGDDLYDEVYWASLVEEPVLKVARSIWTKNASKDDEVTWSYDDWQQRKMRRYQILMTLRTLMSLDHKFNYDLKDPKLVESVQNRVPATHITSDQVKLNKVQTEQFKTKIFGTGPEVDEFEVNDRFVQLTEANRAAAKKQLDEIKKGGE